MVAWVDRRRDAGDIYAQRIAADGLVADGWPPNGVAVCTAVGAQDGVAIATDGAGGALIILLLASAAFSRNSSDILAALFPTATLTPTETLTPVPTSTDTPEPTQTSTLEPTSTDTPIPSPTSTTMIGTLTIP